MEPKQMIGHLVADRYTLITHVGTGAFGQVFTAQDAALDRLVLVKIAHDADPSTSMRLQREAQVLSQIRSAHIVALLEVGSLEDGRGYLVTDWIDGCSLDRLLAERGRLPRDVALAIAEQIAVALRDAHRAGLLHRDLKPANVIVEHCAPSPPPKVYLTDFGVAGLLRRSTQTTVMGEIFGSPAYMAPEQLLGREQSPATDIYALGLVLYEMLTGQRPFEANTAFDLLQQTVLAPSVEVPPGDLPPDLLAFIRQCLERNSTDRPTDGAAALLELQHLQMGGAPLETMSSAESSLKKDKRPRSARSFTKPLTWLLVLAVVMPLVMAIGLTLASAFSWEQVRRALAQIQAPFDVQWMTLGILIIAAAATLGGLLHHWLARRRTALQDTAGAILTGSRRRRQLTETLALEVDSLIEQMRQLDKRIMARTVALMLLEYQSARTADDRRNALLKSMELLEKLTSHMTPWYVRYEKLLVFFVTGIGLVSGVLSMMQGFQFPNP